MSQDKAGVSDGRKIAPVYIVRNQEVMLDAPVERAWPHVIDYPSWQNYSLVQHVSGTPGREGQVVLLQKDEKGVAFPPYYARTIKLDPGRRIVWKTYPQTRTPERDYFGFVDFTLYDAAGKTRFCCNALYEFLIPYNDELQLQEFRRQQDENAALFFTSVLPKLRRIVAQGIEC